MVCRKGKTDGGTERWSVGKTNGPLDRKKV